MTGHHLRHGYAPMPLNESPSEKEGKYGRYGAYGDGAPPLNESPSEKEGKWAISIFFWCSSRGPQ